MMKKILMSVYAVCALLVIIGSLLWFVFTLHSDSTAGKTEALKNFKMFAQHTGRILSESAQERNPTQLQVQLEQLCRNYSKYVKAVLLRDSTGIVFIWPKNTDIFSYNEQYMVEVKNLPLFFTAAQIHIPIEKTSNTITAHAALQMLPLETVFNRGQIVFFLFLLIVLMTASVLIFSYINLKPSERKTVLESVAHTSKTDTTESDAVQVDEIPSTATSDEKTIRPFAKPFTGTETSTLQQRENFDPHKRMQNNSDQPSPEKNNGKPVETASSLPLNVQLESLNRLHIYDDERSQQKRPEYPKHAEDTQLERGVTEEQEGIDARRSISSNTVETDNSKTSGTSESNTKQNFGAENYGSFENHTQTLKPITESQEHTKQASVTTFENAPISDEACSEDHSLEQATLIEELTTAITETAVAEEDLTLLLIHATDIPHNQQIIHLLRSTLDRIHKVFAFNKDILGVIIFYAPLDQAMQIASTLYDEIYTVLDDSTKKSLSIGLTTRAGRLIPAPRMIEEASAAISKATEEGSDPIVAFRVNPDKYRRCLARLS